MPPATVEVKVFSDLRVLLDGQRRRAAADESASGQAAQPPDEVEAAGGGPSGKEPRRRSLPQGVTTALTAHANKETTSPSDMLSPCSEVLLRRKGLVDVQVDQMAFARSLESVRVAPSSPGTQLRAGIPPDVDSSGLDGENPLRSPLDELRSPLAALGSSSHSNTPRKRAAKSFGETAKAAEAQPSPSALRSKAQEIMPRLRDAGRSSFLPAEVEEEEAQYNDENASALPQGPTPKIAARDKCAQHAAPRCPLALFPNEAMRASHARAPPSNAPPPRAQARPRRAGRHCVSNALRRARNAAAARGQSSHGRWR
ncbi:hypothetical protein T492DRAFT_422017 [Pavlovales sp. CCMP2436]|nr:hypothetical protein T492DRAFT_454061 [Pavlovales sp. CCMP2436]KAJ1619330.1 hypothetical protein T492DRAFT_422017 [Pavlovales sp. CCMP2436]